jgi:hypothetical protein
MTAEPITQRVTATSFLAELFAHAGDGWLHLFALDRTTGERHVAWKPTSSITELTEAARRLAPTSCVWFGAAPRSQAHGRRRGTAADCTGITSVWVDIDIAGPNHALDDLPPDHDAALSLLADFPVPPSAVVDTGGGIQPWWFLHDLVEPDEAVPFLARWGATWVECGRRRGWHVDNVFDIARIMRLPATVNRKTEPHDVIVTDWHPDRRYGVDDLDQWTVEPPAAPERTLERSVPYIGPERPGDAFNAAVDSGHLLEQAGFVLERDDGGDRHYVAPHHVGERAPQTGATVYTDGHTTIWSETFANQAGMQVKRPYDPFGLYTHLRHGGDWRKASDALAALGYGTKAVTTLADLIGPLQAATDANPGTVEVTGDDDWDVVDLVPIAQMIRAGELEPTRPTILAVRDSFPLIYRERINSLFGESGGGKTWVALAACCEVVRDGGCVLFVDYEDNPNGIAERLVLLGLTGDEIARFEYRNPTTGIGRGVPQIEKAAARYDLVVIDSTGEAMAAGGVNSDSDTEVALWFAFVKHLTRIPGAPAVVVLDHVPKSTDAPSLFGIGSQRKRAAVTGAAYRVDTLKEPARGKDGTFKLTVAKDRPGARARGSVACHIEVHSGDTLSIEAHLTDAQIAAATGARFRPTVLMGRVSDWLTDNPDSTVREIQGGVSGRKEMVAEALDVLVDEGWVEVSRGSRGAKNHRVSVTFSEWIEPPNSSGPPSPTVPHRTPGDGQTTVPRPPTPTEGDGGDGQLRPEMGSDSTRASPDQSLPLRVADDTEPQSPF